MTNGRDGLGARVVRSLREEAEAHAETRWEHATTPAEAHEFLREKLVGDWIVRTWVGDDEAGAADWTCSARAALGGRCVERRAAGRLLGMDCEGLMIFGFDRVRRLFHLSVFDTLNTGPKTLWGALNERGDTLTFVGPMDEPMTGEIGKPFMAVWVFEPDGSHRFELREIVHGQPVSVLHAHARREG